MLKLSEIVLFTILIILISALGVPSQVRTGKKDIQKSADKFLTVWLEQKDIHKALSYFDKSSYRNRENLNETCAGYVPANKKNRTAIKQGAIKFLTEFSNSTGKLKSSEILDKKDQEVLSKEARELKIRTSENYQLFWLNRRIAVNLVDEARYQYLKRFFRQKPSVAQIVSLNFDDNGQHLNGTVYFFWIKSRIGWKIFHAGMLCV